MDEAAEIVEADLEDILRLGQDEEGLLDRDGEDLDEGVVMVVPLVYVLAQAAQMGDVLVGELGAQIIAQALPDGVLIGLLGLKMSRLDDVISAGVELAALRPLLNQDVGLAAGPLEHPDMGDLVEKALCVDFLAGGCAYIVKFIVIDLENIGSSVHISLLI